MYNLCPKIHPSWSYRFLFDGLLLMLLLCNTASSLSQSTLRFEHLDLDDGLSHNSIQCLFQDSRGFMWIGTNYGLNKYDGHSFTVYHYDPSDPNSLSSNYVLSIYEDQEETLWIGTMNGGFNRFDREKEQFIRYQADASNPNSLSNNNVTKIIEDKQGLLWLSTYGGGLNRFDKKSKKFQQYLHDSTDPNSLSSNNIQTIFEDRDGKLWIGTIGKGLNRFDPKSQVFHRFVHEPSDPNSLSNDYVWAIFEDQEGLLWIGTRAGLDYFDARRGKFSHLAHQPADPNSLSHNWVSGIIEDETGKLWIGTREGGLNCYDRESKHFKRFAANRSDRRTLSGNVVSSVYIDHGGVLWVGTFGEGLNLVAPAAELFRQQLFNPVDTNGLHGNYVRSIYEDQDRILWVGTTGGGLNRVDRAKGTTQHYVHHPLNPNSLIDNDIWTIYKDKKGIFWIGTSNGLNRYDPQKELFQRFVHDPTDPNSLSHKLVWSIYEDRAGQLWIGTMRGLNRFDREREQFHRFLYDASEPDSRSLNSCKAIIEDSAGMLWIGTPAGLISFDRERKQFQPYVHHPSNPNSLSNNSVLSIFEDRETNLWIGTGGGLNRFDHRKKTFTSYYEKDGLPNDIIIGILEDDEGKLWLSTGKGLSRFDPEQESFRNYDSDDGLHPRTAFSIGAHHKGAYSGEFYFGGKEGITLFHPNRIKDNQFIPPIVLSSFQRYNTKAAEGVLIKEKGISEKSAISLSHHDKILSFDLAALNYNHPDKNQYAYQLLGFSNQWIYLGTEHKVTFTNLDPGKYILKVKGTNNHGLWNPNPTELKIRMLPSWWQSPLAYALYFILFFGLLYTFYRIQLQRKLDQQESNRLREIDQLKNRFFANITHEFRTPLTVVSGMSDQIGPFLDQRAYEKVRETAEIIKQNSNKQLNLINQLLDLTKLEEDKLKLHLVKGDVVRYLQFLTESFQSFADSKKIRLTFYREVDELIMDYDAEKLLAILSNLLTNAFKFTPEKGKIILHVNKIEIKGDPFLLIKVKDTGHGIDESSLPFIFDRFYQVDSSPTRQEQGSGIGLALAKELVELMGGQISVKSQVGKGTAFSIQLPALSQVSVPLVIEEQADSLKKKTNVFLPVVRAKRKEKKSASGVDKHPLILIVEDNPDIVIYLRTCLQAKYQLTVASDGKEGIDKAIEEIPDLIISDVMMPKKDGYEVTEILKNDERTSHIPIILLTAKATHADKLSGLKRGADAYLTKPFDKEELEIRIHQQLELRKKLQVHYRNLTHQHPTQTRLEDSFLQKIRQIVENHLSDPDFSTTHLCRELGMSRSQTYRKLMALTDRSASHLIRSIRLQKAKEILLNSELSIAEVAYDVGFKDPSYFTRTFVEEFGSSPRAMRERL